MVEATEVLDRDLDEAPEPICLGMGRSAFLLSADPLPNQGERRAQCPEMIELPGLAWLLSPGREALFLEFDRVEHDLRFDAGELAGERFDWRPAAVHLAGAVDETRGADRSFLLDSCPEPLELVARAQLETGDLEAAAATASQGLAAAEAVGFGTVTWSLRLTRDRALGAPNNQADEEFRALADRIHEPELRWWFERQPMAPD